MPEIFVLQAFGSVPGAVSVQLTRETDIWQLDYSLDAAQHVLQYAQRGPRGGGDRVDELWRETCCELFVAGPGAGAGLDLNLATGHAAQADTRYLEFNFSPAGDWAAYVFDAPRQGMRAHIWEGPRPHIARVNEAPVGMAGFAGVGGVGSVVGVGGSRDQIRVRLSTRAFRDCVPARIALSVVMKTAETVSYWALSHPGAEADFHHPDSFVALATTGAV